eukprot:CAMPEP_0178374024 /NCGR_PEP_ID=MMETSP0689_2-20121128/2166_1 /TAXON_ID=160604 /ORGANISM="Amphidinium massartii, Strain CS-259" /LENGTH=37 /DNA_ID= /DNA_START= /DNA_END= /DNA_ORIENTATION=
MKLQDGALGEPILSLRLAKRESMSMSSTPRVEDVTST